MGPSCPERSIIPFRQPEAIDDPLTEVAREGACRMLAQVLIAEADAFVAQWKDLKLRTAATASCGTAMDRCGQSRPGLGPLRFDARRCAKGLRDPDSIETFGNRIYLFLLLTGRKSPKQRSGARQCATSAIGDL
jgi:hypothetical protein